MAVVGTSNLTMLDLASRMEDGSVAKNIIELQSKTNEVLDDMVMVECNNGSGHITTVRTGIPDATWRLLNYGVNQTKSTTAQIKDSCGQLENYSTVDSKLVKLSGDPGALLMSEAKPIIEGMGQQLAQTIFYGNTTVNPERFMGLAPRFNSLSAESGDNIINGGGAGATNTSIWLVVWGDDSVHGIYPKGTQAGIQQEDLGEQTVYDVNGNPYQAKRSHYEQNAGLCVRDWRQVVRVANVNTTTLVKNSATGADILDLMVQALETAKSLSSGKAAFYCNRTVRGWLRRQMMNRTSSLLSLDEVANGGRKVLGFDGIPVRRVDALLNTEATVS